LPMMQLSTDCPCRGMITGVAIRFSPDDV